MRDISISLITTVARLLPVIDIRLGRFNVALDGAGFWCEWRGSWSAFWHPDWGWVTN
jgi:hypothetical protein